MNKTTFIIYNKNKINFAVWKSKLFLYYFLKTLCVLSVVTLKIIKVLDVITGSYDFRLIDFGLITPFKNPNTQEPLEEVKDSKFMGTPYFWSLSMAKRNIYSRRDDIESTIYCLAYLIKGKLPWDQEYYLIEEEKWSPKSSQGNEWDKILERK